MKKISVVCIMLSLLIGSFSSLVLAEETSTNLTINYSFSAPKLEKTNIDGTIYDQLLIDGAPCFGNPGDPFMPMKGAYILLPENTRVKDISVTYDREVSLGQGYNIEPVGELVTTLNIANSKNMPTKNEEIYSSEEMFPGSLFTEIGTYSFRGYDILVLTLYPAQYTPSTGEIIYYPNLKVNIETVQKQDSNLLYRSSIKDRTEVLKKINNPNILSTYSVKKSQLVATEDQYDLLILTTNELKAGFQPLKEVHDNNGISTEIKTLAEVSVIPDSVTPEKIRDFVTNEYQKYGIEYLLIGGDVGVVPHKMLYVSGMDEDKWFYEAEMPVDQYYGYLDGPFNNDGDELWGETNDGQNGGDVDLLAEVYVGRACVDDINDVNNFVHKTKSYIETDFNDEYLSKVLLAGEYLGDHGVSSFGGDLLDPLMDGSDIDGFKTVGIPSEKYNIDTLYDRDWPGYGVDNEGWVAEDLIERVNNNVHILTHDGHSYYGYNMRMTNDYIDMFTNDKYYFAYSVGCMAGGFDDPDEYDCYGEVITVKSDTGAFAGIWNARYGFFWSQRTDGDGSMFLRQFWDAVFGENIPNLGKANQDSKEDNLHLLTRSCMRWTYYQLNLFGDPSVSFKVSRPPEKPKKPEGPSSINSGEEYTYNSSTTDPEGQQIYYIFSWGDGSDSGWLGPYESGSTVKASHAWSKTGNYQIKVKARDIYGAEGPWSDVLSVSLPRSKSIVTNNIMVLFYKILELFRRESYLSEI